MYEGKTKMGIKRPPLTDIFRKEQFNGITNYIHRLMSSIDHSPIEGKKDKKEIMKLTVDELFLYEKKETHCEKYHT